ncbi:MAG TPA: hypothetical protein VMB46_03905 [Methanomassiliicoccales archaeon]|nr:hypothetical protein [Methanomassiliicoccales archaeon]
MELEDLNGVQMEWEDKGLLGHRLRLSYQGRIVAEMKSTLALNRIDACFDQREVEIEEHLSTKKAYTISSKDLREEICSLSMILFNASSVVTMANGIEYVARKSRGEIEITDRLGRVLVRCDYFGARYPTFLPVELRKGDPNPWLLALIALLVAQVYLRNRRVPF